MSVRTTSSAVRVRREKTRGHARRDILLAAAAVFARRGYEASTLAELAQASGYAAASLYRYFESKEELFRSLVELFNAELDATFERPVDRTLPLQERLAALFLVQLKLAQSHRAIFVVIWNEQPGLASKKSVDRLRVGLLRYQERLSAWLLRHVARRELRCSREDAARALTGLFHAFHHRELVSGPQREVERPVRLILDLALHGMQKSPAGTR